MPMSEVRFWDIETGERVADFHGDEDFGFGFGALSRDGRRVAVADFGRLRILDAATGQTERTIELPGSLRPPAGVLARWNARRDADRQSIGLFEVSTGRRLHHDASTPVGFHRIRRVVAVGRSDRYRARRRFRAGLGRRTGKLIWHRLLAPVIGRRGWNARPAFVSFSRDGKLVVAAGRPGRSGHA